MLKKLIVTDIDGTLLDHHGNISIETKEAVGELRNLGMDLTLATGRDPKTCNWIVEELNIVQPIITHNGGSIYDPIKHEYLYYEDFKFVKLLNILNYCKNKFMNIHLVTKDKIYIEVDSYKIFTSYFPDVVEVSVVDSFNSFDHMCIKMGILLEESKVLEVWRDLQRKYPEWYIVASGENGLDIHGKLVNKGEALKYLSKILKINTEQIITFGNYYNDIELLEYAGLGVAVNNAPQLVKESADMVTNSHMESGLAKFLKKFVFNKVI